MINFTLNVKKKKKIIWELKTVCKNMHLPGTTFYLAVNSCTVEIQEEEKMSSVKNKSAQ